MGAAFGVVVAGLLVVGAVSTASAADAGNGPGSKTPAAAATDAVRSGSSASTSVQRDGSVRSTGDATPIDPSRAPAPDAATQKRIGELSAKYPAGADIVIGKDGAVAAAPTKPGVREDQVTIDEGGLVPPQK